MLDLKAIQKKYQTSETTVDVKAWGGEVKIRQLTVSESAEVAHTSARGEGVNAMVKNVAFALVEPSITFDELSKLPGDSFEGIKEINDALSELNEPKK